MILFNLIYRFLIFVKTTINKFFSKKYAFILMKLNKVILGKRINSLGIPKLFIHQTAKVKIGHGFRINNTVLGSPIGRNHRCLFSVRENANLFVGNNVGMSGTMIFCQNRIEIGDNVKIGGNVCIYDTDFHSLNSKERQKKNEDRKGTKISAVKIGNNVFIGAHSTVLKGVSIGDNSIIGACSVVTKNVPINEIWAGNPAKFIRKLKNDN